MNNEDENVEMRKGRKRNRQKVRKKERESKLFTKKIIFDVMLNSIYNHGKI